MRENNLVEYAGLLGGLIGGLGSWAFFNAYPLNPVTIYCFKGSLWVLQQAGVVNITAFKVGMTAAGIIGFISMILCFVLLLKAEIRIARWLGKRAKEAVDTGEHEMPVEEEVRRSLAKFGRN